MSVMHDKLRSNVRKYFADWLNDWKNELQNNTNVIVLFEGTSAYIYKSSALAEFVDLYQFLNMEKEK